MSLWRKSAIIFLLLNVIVKADTSLPSPPLSKLSNNLKGVNLSGGEYNWGPNKRIGYDYIYPSKAEIDYYAGKGFGVVRLPFDIGRVYPTPSTQLDPTQIGAIKGVVDYALKKGMRVILDPHNYGDVYDGWLPSPYVTIGIANSSTVLFADFWHRLANTFVNYPNVIFGLMNEPNQQTAQQWHDAAVVAVAAIRTSGATQPILVPGTYWTGATSFGAGTANSAVWEGFKDQNFAFEMHQYLDSDSSGTHTQCTVGAGASRLAAATAWLQANNFYGFLGEFGWSQDPTCPPEAKAFMDYLSANPKVWIGWTYWAGGPWLGSYMYSVEPANFAAPVVDKPQMRLLTGHL